MGRLSAVLFLVAACGDNMGGLETPAQQHPTRPGNTTMGQPTARLAPAVCGVGQWSVPAGNDPLLDLSVASEHGATSILAVPQVGGSMTGFTVNDRMTVVSDPNQTKIPIDGVLSAVSASIVGGRVLAASVETDAVHIHLFGDGLTNPQELVKLSGTAISKPAFMSTNGTTVAVVGGDTGLTMTSFDTNFVVGETKLMAATNPVTSLATTQYGQAILAAWSTSAHECYIADVAGFAAGQTSHTQTACEHPRIAADIANNSAALVFEPPQGGLALMHISHMQMGGAAAVLRPEATSPRVVFDGTRYWISYIDPRGGIVVGFLDGDSHLTSMGLVGPAPQDNAYELAMVDGHPWVISLDMRDGYTVHQMCAEPATEQ